MEQSFRKNLHYLDSYHRRSAVARVYAEDYTPIDKFGFWGVARIERTARADHRSGTVGPNGPALLYVSREPTARQHGAGNQRL
jgi:hypothetical protein